MADQQPDNTEWVVVKHRRFPVVVDEVLGHYPTAADALPALQSLLANPEWFTGYTIEHRNK